MLEFSLAKPSDAPAIADVMEELDRFYGATAVEPRPDRIAEIEARLFGRPAAAFVLLARDRAEIVGLASYSFLWPAAGLSQSLYLKELYVPQAHRRRGVGKALMQAICRTAADSGCSRVEWTTEHTNADAVSFYANLGAPINPDKAFYRLDAEALHRISQS